MFLHDRYGGNVGVVRWLRWDTTHNVYEFEIALDMYYDSEFKVVVWVDSEGSGTKTFACWLLYDEYVEVRGAP